MVKRTLMAAILPLAVSLPCLAEEPNPKDQSPQEQSNLKPADAPASRPIRNAPSPRALELSAYIFSASNVCGYKIGTSEFAELLAKFDARPEDVAPTGVFGRRIQGMFSLMSNDMALHREQSCLAVAGEYGPDGKIARNVLQPAPQGDAKPAQ